MTMLWRLMIVGTAAAASERYLLYASHSGLGNQMRALKNALIIAKMANRTLVVPPPLHHYEIKRASVCNHECMAELALKFYREIPGNFLEVLTVTDGPKTVAYSEKFERPIYDFSLHHCQEKEKDVCVPEDWEPFLRNDLPIIMIGSALIWPKGNFRNFGVKPLPSFVWRQDSPLFRTVQTQMLPTPYSCLYIRHSDLFDDLYKPPEYMEKPPTPEQRAAGRQSGFQQIADKLTHASGLHQRVYVASNVESKPICDALKNANVISDCYAAKDAAPTGNNATNMMPLCELAFLDMFACSQAIQQSFCFISNERAGGTFWQTIVDFTPDHARLLRPKCSTINEAYDFGARLYKPDFS